jgi:hypothetical protein
MKKAVHLAIVGLIKAGSATPSREAAEALVEAAVAAGKIPAAFRRMQREWVVFKRKYMQIGTAVVHEIFDFSHTAVLLSFHEEKGTPYQIQSSARHYVIVSRDDDGEIQIEEANVKVAKRFATRSAGQFGKAIEDLRGYSRFGSA